MASHLKLFDEAFREIGIGKLASVSADRDEIKVSATLPQEQQSMFPKLIEGITSSGVLEVVQADVMLRENDLEIELVCRPKTSDEKPAASKPGAPELTNLLNKLYPDANIELLEANKTAVIIRGDVDAETANRIVSVAEQYYPTVLNFAGENHRRELSESIRSALPPAVRIKESTRSNSVGDLKLLHQDIKSLHGDVKTLIKMLEREG